MKDYEDAVQASCAERMKADYIVTHNLKDFVASSIPAISPGYALDIIEGGQHFTINGRVKSINIPKTSSRFPSSANSGAKHDETQPYEAQADYGTNSRTDESILVSKY